DRAHATFTTVVDRDGLLASAFGFKVIPNGLLIDEHGVLRFKQIGGFDVHKADVRHRVETFLRGSLEPQSEAPAQAPRPPAPSADRWEQHSQAAARWLDAGDVKAAAAELRQALLLDPANFLVRKQLWRVLHPERFGEQI